MGRKNKYDGGIRAEGAEERRLTSPGETDRLASVLGHSHGLRMTPHLL